MDELRNKLLSRKNIISLLLLGILMLSIPFTVDLIKKQTRIVSQAAAEDAISFSGDNVKCEVKNGKEECIALDDTFNIDLKYGEIGVPPVPGRRSLCASTTVSPTTLSTGGQITITSTSKEANLQNFRYQFYNRDNLGTDGSPKIICQAGLANALGCPSGSGPLVINKEPVNPNDKSFAALFDFAEFDKPDANWGNKKPIRIQVNGYFVDKFGVISIPEIACAKPFDLEVDLSTIVPDCTNLTTTADVNNLQVGIPYTFNLTAGGTAPVTSVEMSVYDGASCSGAGLTNLKPYAPVAVNGPGTYQITWTPTQSGSFTAYGRVWNDGIAECRSECVDGVPRYLCQHASACKLTGNVKSSAADTNSPIGYETYGTAYSTTCQNISGWTCDLDSKDTQLQVDIWDLGATDSTADNISLGSVTANRTDIHPEQAVKDLCGGSTVSHGYSWDIPASLKDGQSRTIAAFGINIDSAGQRSSVKSSTLLRSGPVTVSCTQ